MLIKYSKRLINQDIKYIFILERVAKQWNWSQIDQWKKAHSHDLTPDILCKYSDATKLVL